MDRQKVVTIFGIALVSAALLTWFLYAKTQAPQQERRVQIMAAARDLASGTLIRKTDLKVIAVRERETPKGALLTEREALNRVLLYPVSQNEPLTSTKLSAQTSTEGISSMIPPGYRAVSVQITDVSGVGGLIQPNSRVDVMFTRPGNMAEAITTTVLQNVRVLAMGRTVQPGQSAVDPKATKLPVVTLVLTPGEAQKLELAKNQGKISLALRNPLDAEAPASGVVTTEVLDPMVSARLARARRGRTTNIAGRMNLEDPKVWQKLTGEKKVQQDKEKLEEEARRKKEAEKPRVVVDVYRGDKHVQELFR